MELMEDETDEVRDWATFGLGQFDRFEEDIPHYPDSPEIRAAFYKRLGDTYEDARREAIWGLSRRKDPIGLKLLIQLLESEDCWTGDEMAAEETLNAESDTPVEELCRGLRLLLPSSTLSLT